jgi:fluoroquinolone resistance protein
MGLFSRENKIKRWKPKSLDALLENIASGQKNFENIDLRWKEFRLDRQSAIREDNKTTITFSQRKDFSHCNFTNSRLSDCIMMTADFSHCNFTNSEMKWIKDKPKDFDLDEYLMMKRNKPYFIKFNDSNFTGSKLNQSIFKFTDFTNADFTNADLGATKFYNCNLTNTIFKDARIKHLEISECIFEKTAYGAPSDITRAQTGKYEIDGIEYENETN